MSDGEHRTVLIVDDEETSRELVRRKLRGSYRTLSAGDAETALEIVDSQAVDIVISDVMMPDVSGYELCEKIKSRAGGGFLPVILLTSLSQQEDRNRGLTSGADEFLSKPVNSRELNLRVNSLLRIREQDHTIRTQRRWLKRAVDRLAAVNRVGDILSASLQGGDPFGPATEAMSRELDLDLAAIALLDGGSPKLRGTAPEGAQDEAATLLSRPGAAQMLASGELEVDREDRRICWAPIRDSVQTLGLLVARSSRPDPLANDDLSALSTIATQVSMWVSNHEFVDVIQTHSAELETVVVSRTAALERQNRFTSQIIDSLPVSLYVVDRDRTVVAWNRQRELGELGVVREKAVGRSLYELFDRQSKEALESELRPVFDHGKTLYLECDSTVDGEPKHFRIHKLPMCLEPGEVTHVVTIGEEITEQRRLEKTMVLTEKMAAVGRLVAGVAHEINNPLATVATCAEALKGRLGEFPPDCNLSDEFREYLDIVEQEAYRAKRISEDLLDFSRTRPSTRKVHDLSRIVERTLIVLKHHAGFKRADLECRLDDNLPQVCVEEDSIVQVLMALIINAVDAMPEGGRLSLSTDSEGDTVRCSIEDSGCGIAPADLSSIFDPFFTTKPPGHGTGLGLTVCYGIVEAHGGHIEVDSNPGKGSCFTISLPSAAAKAEENEGEKECRQPTLSDC